MKFYTKDCHAALNIPPQSKTDMFDVVQAVEKQVKFGSISLQLVLFLFLCFHLRLAEQSYSDHRQCVSRV